MSSSDLVVRRLLLRGRRLRIADRSRSSRPPSTATTSMGCSWRRAPRLPRRRQALSPRLSAVGPFIELSAAEPRL